MSISTETRKAGPLAANGAIVNYPFAFKVFNASDLLVVYTDTSDIEHTLVLNTNYSVTLNADQDDNPGGTVTTVSTYATGTFITITSALTYTQSLELTNAGGFYPDVINDALDRVVILAQQLNERVSRAILGPISASEFTNIDHLVFGIDANGLPILKVLTDLAPSAVSAFMLTMLNDADAAEARTTLGIPAAIQNQTYVAYTTAGAAPAFTITTSPTYGAYAAGQKLRVKFNANGTTGANTLNMDSLGAKNLKQYDATGTKIAAVVYSGQLALVEYDGTDMVILNPLPPSDTSVKVNKRQTVTIGPIDSNGWPSFIPDTDVDLNFTTQNINGSAPLIVTASQGSNQYGSVDRVGQTTSNLTWTGLTANSTNYLYVTVNADGTLTPGFTVIEPVYVFGSTPSVTADTFTFNTQEMTMYKGDGATANKVYAVFVGEAVTDGSSVTSTIAYAYKGKYDSAYTSTLPAAAVEQLKWHKIGTVLGVRAQVIIENITTELGYAVGDVIVSSTGGTNASYYYSHPIFITRNTVGFCPTSSGTGWSLGNKTTGVLASLTLAKWKWKIIAERDW